MTSLLQHPDVSAAIALFSQWVEGQMAYREQPGISVGVAYDQELIWSRGFGYSDLASKAPATPQTIYRIASITKLFTSTAIVQLRDAGKLNLDDPIVKHLPWFAIRSRFLDAPPITIRNLLTHTAGLPREANFPYWTDLNFPSHDQIVESLPDQDLSYAPYTRWKYSNLGLALAGEIVAAVSGQPYAAYIQEHILSPLGMDSTSVVLSDAQRQRLATGYTRRIPGEPRSATPFTDCAGITPAANMSSTVEDLSRFAALQFRGGPAGSQQILAGSSLREMHRIHWLAEDWTHGWGLGFAITREDGKVHIGHGGSLSGYRTQLSFNPDDKVAFAVMTNASDGVPDVYIAQCWKILAPAILKAAKPVSAPVSLDGLERYVGTYRSSWGDLVVALQPTGLVLFAPNVDDPLTSPMTLTAEGEHSFRTDGKDGYATVGELATFELGPDGQPTRLKIGVNYSERVQF